MNPLSDAFYQKAERFASEGKIPLSGKVILGLSGGGDSVALLHLLMHFGTDLHCIHVNHGIRGDEAKRDENFCRELCDKLKVPLTVMFADVPALASESGKGLEEAARDIRWDYLLQAAKQNGADAIAVAHNANDSAETVIFNLVRGAGTRGLSGIQPVRHIRGVTVIRPLLCFTKDEIISYLQSIGQEFMTDSTNSDTEYTRNYIRCEILPRLSKINPAYIKNINSTAEKISQCDSLIQALADRCLAGERITRDDYLSSHPAVRARMISDLYEKSSSKQLLQVHTKLADDFIKNAENGKRLMFPSGYDLYAENGTFTFVKRGDDAEYNYPLVLGENDFPSIGAKIFMETADTARPASYYLNIYKLVKRLILNSAMLNSNLYIRNRAEGDCYIYGGMTHSVKKLLSEKKIPSSSRRLYPVICDDEGILAVPPFSPRDGCRGDGGLYLTYVSTEQ